MGVEEGEPEAREGGSEGVRAGLNPHRLTVEIDVFVRGSSPPAPD